MNLSLVVLAAGISSRYGKLKQLDPVGPSGEALMDYGVFDAIGAGFSKVIFVTRREIEHQIREHIEPRFGDRVNVAFVSQSLQDVPKGTTVSASRVKPWGTAQAILSARQEIDQPFVVCNADDFYGREAYRILADYFTRTGDWNTGSVPNDYALAGYHLRDTLSPFGGVTRAICRNGPAGTLEGLVEVSQIQERQGQLTGTDESGDRLTLRGDETVSMNLWGFQPPMLQVLERQFHEFLADCGDSLDREFQIPVAVGRQIELQEARVKVLPTRERWIGMTFIQDRSRVVEYIHRLVLRGAYPDRIAADSDS
jgi:hypothetical protein